MLLAQAADNPAMLKFMLALEGVAPRLANAIATPASAAVERLLETTEVELVLRADLFAHARVNPASPIELIEHQDGIALRDPSVIIPVRMVTEPAFTLTRNRREIASGEIVRIRGSYAAVMLGGGCGLNQPGHACAFCLGRELTQKAGERWPVDEVVEALRGAFDEGAAEFVHFHLGYFPGDDAGLFLLRPYLDAIHRHFDTIVAVTMHPPASLRMVELTYAAGADVIAYNLEAADEAAMRRYFPGRTRFFGRARYLEALRHAARIFPNGAVWCELLLDLSSAAATAAAIDELTAAGVTPLIGFSPVRCRSVTSAEAASLLAQLYNSATRAGLSATWARDISSAIVPFEARFFVPNAPQIPVLIHLLTRNRLGALTTRSLARMRRRLRVKRVRASFD
ncbi:MAG: radical SAM protein, partial [Candidatus Binataceae bacterium]